MSELATDRADCPLAAVVDTAEQSIDALWLLLAAPLEPRAFNAALAEHVAKADPSSARAGA